MTKTKQELEKEFEAYKAAAKEREKKLKKRLLAGEKSNSEAIRTLYDKHEKVVKENEELKEMLDKINKDYMNLSLEYNNLELTIENKNEAYKKLEKSCIKYQSQIKESEEDYEALNKEFYDLLEKYEELKKELEEEKAKSKFIPLPPRPDFSALLKCYTDLQKDHEQLDKDFKDLYGRYEKQLTRANHLTQAMNSIYGIPGIAGLEKLKEEKEKLLKENEELKLKNNAKHKRIVELDGIIASNYITIDNLTTKIMTQEGDLRALEHSFGIKAENIYDILNAWFVVSEKLEIIEPILHVDNLEYKFPDHIAMTGRIHLYTDPKEFEIVKKAMGIKPCQSK